MNAMLTVMVVNKFALIHQRHICAPVMMDIGWIQTNITATVYFVICISFAETFLLSFSNINECSSSGHGCEQVCKTLSDHTCVVVEKAIF